MVKHIMYKKIQDCKKKGLNQAEIIRTTGLNKRTVRKYYYMSRKQYLQYMEQLRYRMRAFEPFKEEILNIHEQNNFKKLEKAAVYDYLEEKFGEKFESLGTERSFRGYILYLIETEQLKFNKTGREYHPVEEHRLGKQMQIDFGEYRQRDGLKHYIFAAALSASRYKYCATQEKPFTTLDVIGHILNYFQYIGGIPEEIVIDQDRIMVVSENKGDIIYTKDFKNFKEEMGFKMYVCRKSDPESKGRIENLIKFVKNNFFKIRNFANIQEAQESLWRWLIRRANGKISQATGRIPKDMIDEERKHLKPLRNSIYQKDDNNVRARRTPDNLGLISVKSCKYAVPADYRDKEVEIYQTEEKLFIYDIKNGEQIKEYDSCRIPGTRVKDRERHYLKEQKQIELKEQFKKLIDIEKWSELVEENFNKYRRYFRDQYYDGLKKFGTGIERNYMEPAITYCLENKTYSMGNLWDTYRYFKQDTEQEQRYKLKFKMELRDIPSVKKEISVEKRPLCFYKRLITAQNMDVIL